MATLSLVRLEQTLADLGLSMATFVGAPGISQAALASILDRQRRLDRWQQRSSELEAELAVAIGWPRLVVELDDQGLEFVSTMSEIDQLVVEQKVSPADADWLKQKLADQLRRWRLAEGPRALLQLVRDRERRLAERQSEALEHFIGSTGSGLPSVVTRLIIIVATIEPGPTTNALLTIASDLLHLDR